MTAAHILISHSTADEKIVAEIRRALEGLGLTVWVDSRELSAGVGPSKKTLRRIEQAAHFIIVLSPQVMKSLWTAEEIRHALKVERERSDTYKVIPILLGGVEPSALHHWFGARDRLAVRIDSGYGAVAKALPELLAALDVHLPFTSVPAPDNKPASNEKPDAANAPVPSAKKQKKPPDGESAESIANDTGLIVDGEDGSASAATSGASGEEKGFREQLSQTSPAADPLESLLARNLAITALSGDADDVYAKNVTRETAIWGMGPALKKSDVVLMYIAQKAVHLIDKKYKRPGFFGLYRVAIETEVPDVEDYPWRHEVELSARLALDPPITLDELREHSVLGKWGLLKTNFIGVGHLKKPVGREEAKALWNLVLPRLIPSQFPDIETFVAEWFGETDETAKRIAPPLPDPVHRPDPARLHADTPAQEDQLGRKGFADALAIWLKRYWKETCQTQGRSFILHLYGPWGAGKTTLLKLLEGALQGDSLPPESSKGKKSGPVNCGDKPWIVVWFNAWQHQHVEAPWWSLMDSVYRQSVEQTRTRFGERGRAIKICLSERLWRFWSGHRLQVIALAASFLALVGLLISLVWFRIETDTPGFEVFVKTAGAVLAFLGTVWSGTLVLSRSLLSGSASSAQTFVHLAQDPMEKVRLHFGDLLERIGRPVIVFIDDLDRCRAEYVVNLLESMQTLFSDSKLYYVIAADRRWISACFEEVYENFAARVTEPGRQMGQLFLEKAIQLSVPVPQMSPQVQARYLDHLLRGRRSDLREALERERKLADEEFKGAATEEEIFARLRVPSVDALEDKAIDPLRSQIRREAAVRQSASRDVEIDTEHFLQPFSPLLERNPRAMKRLVTAYGVYRALAILNNVAVSREPTERKQLALWTIVSLRWPSLAEHLRNHPKDVDAIRVGQWHPDSQIGVHVGELAGDKEVIRVLNGQGVDVMLDSSALSALLGTQS